MKKVIARLRIIDKELAAIKKAPPSHHIPEQVTMADRKFALHAESNQLWDMLSKKQKEAYLKL